MFDNNYYEDQQEAPPPFVCPWFLRHPTLHTAQMTAIGGITDTSATGLDTRKITGLGIAMSTDDWLLRLYLARLG